jgi:uncharacterized protein DUF2511
MSECVHPRRGLEGHRVARVRGLLCWVGVLLLIPACSPDKGVETKDVSEGDYGSRWPLTIDTAVLACEPGEVPTITVGGHTFRIDTINEPADAHPKFRRIWADSSQQDDGSRRDLAPLVDDAKALCD